MRAKIGILAFALACLPLSRGTAQIDLSGSVDIAYKHDVGKNSDERSSRLNSSIKGQSSFSLVRTRLFADAAVTDQVDVFTTILFDEGLGHFEMEGAYVIFNGVRGKDSVNLLAGKMASVFGTYASRSFATVNPLIGLPLIYHYFSAVRGNSVPRDAADQLARRGDPGGPTYQSRGLPTIYDACWNTGLQVFGATESFNYAVALTKGALSNPAATSNDGAQLVARVGIQPTMGWKLGVSGAYGPYLEEGAASDSDFPDGKSVEDFNQLIVGIDAAYSVWRCEFFLEAVRNQWDVANVKDSLGLTGGYVEGTVALKPRLRYSLRLGQLRYDEIDDGNGGKVAWDYNVRRVETGLEYYIERNVRAKAIVQLNSWDEAAPDDGDNMIGLQLATAF